MTKPLELRLPRVHIEVKQIDEREKINGDLHQIEQRLIFFVRDDEVTVEQSSAHVELRVGEEKILH